MNSVSRVNWPFRAGGWGYALFVRSVFSAPACVRTMPVVAYLMPTLPPARVSVLRVGRFGQVSAAEIG